MSSSCYEFFVVFCYTVLATPIPVRFGGPCPCLIAVSRIPYYSLKYEHRTLVLTNLDFPLVLSPATEGYGGVQVSTNFRIADFTYSDELWELVSVMNTLYVALYWVIGCQSDFGLQTIINKFNMFTLPHNHRNCILKINRLKLEIV